MATAQRARRAPARKGAPKRKTAARRNPVARRRGLRAPWLGLHTLPQAWKAGKLAGSFWGRRLMMDDLSRHSPILFGGWIRSEEDIPSMAQLAPFGRERARSTRVPVALRERYAEGFANGAKHAMIETWGKHGHTVKGLRGHVASARGAVRRALGRSRSYGAAHNPKRKAPARKRAARHRARR